MHSLDPLIRMVHVARKQADAAKVEYDEAVRIAELTFGYTEKRQRLAELTDQLRASVVTEYDADPSQGKTIIGGVKVTTPTIILYDDADALAWAKEHKLFISLDKRAFDGYCKSAPDAAPDFVRVMTKTTASIPTDLSATIEALNADQ